ncbi:MAG: hypothetical protein K0R23_3325 [Lacrimispora sp.]|nr:hypothetical protein [Lacrimispora sp.]
MERRADMQYAALERMLINSIKEVQMKLGYEKEAIRFYYPEKALLRILQAGDLDDDIKEALKEFKAYAKDRLGEIKITKSQERFCFLIPPEGVQYVFEQEEENGFLRDFIETIEKPGVQLEDIKNVFSRYSDGNYVCESCDGEECDFILYFEDPARDSYRYFIKFHDNHGTYHRFLSEDVKDMGF